MRSISLGGMAAHLAPRAAALARLVRRPGRARTEARNATDPYLSVLDCGDGAVKALVIEHTVQGVRVLGSASVPLPPDTGQNLGRAKGAGSRTSVCGVASEAFVAVVEQALVVAEDAAGVIPRRAIFSLAGRDCAVGVGRAEVVRSRPHQPVTEDEVEQLLARARTGALGNARQGLQRERGAAAVLLPVHVAATSLIMDGRGGAVVGQRGERLDVAVTVVFTIQAAHQEMQSLANTLDLEIAAMVCQPYAAAALCAAGEQALVVDVGAEHTVVTLVGLDGVEAVQWLPVGGRTLETHVAGRLSVGTAEARDAVASHAFGAGARTLGSSARLVRQVVEQHTDVWLDGIEVICGELGRDRPLPPRVRLCGGAAILPDLQHALVSPGWQVTLPFERTPSVAVLAASDVQGISVGKQAARGLDLVPVLACAAAYRQSAAAH